MKCSLCDYHPATEFLNLGRQPLANKYPRTEEEKRKEDFYTLNVFFCPQCKNVQLGTVISRERMFEDYYYLSSVNPGLVRHFEDLAEKLAGAQFVVDIGSNDGILLRPLKARGVKAIGVDPSINVSKIANDEGLTTIVSFFNSHASREIKARFGIPDVVVASSIFTHLEDPHTFIEDVKNLMGDNGTCIIEVEYIGNILEKVQFERFYLDRIFYYSLTSLAYLFRKHGMEVTDIEEIEPHGGSIRVTVVKDAKNASVSKRVLRFIEQEAETLTLDRLQKFRQEVDTHIAELRKQLEAYKHSKVKVAGYGAPARVATICNYGKIGPGLIEFIVDDSPLKQWAFSPGTHIPIVPKQHLEKGKPDVLLVFAHEYLDDIRTKTEGRYRYMLPIPPSELI